MDEHVPVLVEEALAGLAPVADGLYVDATFGRGGHTARLLQALGREGRVLALDRDPQAVAAAAVRFPGEVRLEVVHAPFAGLRQVVRERAGGRPVRGILFDLGVSSPQLDAPERGFSFTRDGPLDMRMDPTTGESAAAWIARASVEEMRSVIATLGEERFARRVAEAIDASRRGTPITRTAQLAAIVESAVRTREPGKHPATRSFQALRLHVNDELGQLRAGLDAAFEVLALGGRLAAISFHSLEDRIVKQFMRRKASTDPVYAGLPRVPPHAQPAMRLVGRKLRPSAAEVAANPRARSAVLRVAEKIAECGGAPA
ncbi:MAG: 16S rRNA (cytosine(1402)-N(4))-methyltransferase RsmH [Sinobacteraceae bacterium]|nr:16S rRNA (cytosine(1402)-N(4))-methyltransferase RsmH [Nevskiaceae bacterium]